ncbi:MAG: hypothetical protein ACYDDA_13870 [Acidiferrobacteraceae bacterium]
MARIALATLFGLWPWPSDAAPAAPVITPFSATCDHFRTLSSSIGTDNRLKVRIGKGSDTVITLHWDGGHDLGVIVSAAHLMPDRFIGRVISQASWKQNSSRGQYLSFVDPNGLTPELYTLDLATHRLLVSQHEPSILGPTKTEGYMTGFPQADHIWTSIGTCVLSKP